MTLQLSNFFPASTLLLATVPIAYSKWKKENPWLGLIGLERAICTICTEACAKNLAQSCNANDTRSRKTWVENGYSTWVNASRRIKKHSTSTFHIRNAEALRRDGKISVVQHLSTATKKQMWDNRTALRKIFSTIKLLGQQGLPLRGHDDENSNFLRILKARAEDVSELESWLLRSGNKWLHHDIQNEILEMMAENVLLTNIEEIKNCEFFAFLLDETPDCSRTEQISICIRIVSTDLVSSEFFLGFYATTNTSAETLIKIVMDVFVRFGIPPSKCRGQCYDGAANVSGGLTGLQARVKEIEPRALFVHCNAHNLNLVVQDAVEKIMQVKNFVGIVKELINFIRDSPKRCARFKEIQEELREDNEEKSVAVSAYCPTRLISKLHFKIEFLS